MTQHDGMSRIPARQPALYTLIAVAVMLGACGDSSRGAGEGDGGVFDTSADTVEQDGGDLSDEPDASDDPDTADEPDTAVDPDTTDEPDTVDDVDVDAPVDSDVADEPDTVEDADTGAHTDPDTTDEPDVADTTDEPDVTDTTDEPDVADTTDEPDVADTTDEPDVSDTMDEPDVTDTTDEPDVTDTTDEPDVADSSDVSPDTGGPWTPPSDLEDPWISFTGKNSGLDRVHIVRTDGSDTTAVPTGDILTFDSSWSPDGRRLAIRAAASPSNIIRIVNLETGDITTLSPGYYRISWMAWSPDGRYLAFESTQASGEMADLYAWSFETSEFVQLTDTPAISESAPTWSDPGTLYYSRSSDGTSFSVYSLDVNSGTSTAVTTGDRVTGRPAVSWDGRWVAYQRRVGSDGAELVVFDTELGSKTVVGSAQASGPAFSPDGDWFVFTDSSDTGREIFRSTVPPGTVTQITTSGIGAGVPSVAPVESSEVTLGF
jgi:Tol biopolymer transport system component